MWKFAYIISKLENIGSFIIIFKQHSYINQIIKKYSIIFLFSGFVISLIIGVTIKFDTITNYVEAYFERSPKILIEEKNKWVKLSQVDGWVNAAYTQKVK